MVRSVNVALCHPEGGLNRIKETKPEPQLTLSLVCFPSPFRPFVKCGLSFLLCTCQCQHEALNNALENKYYKTQDAITGHILISLENF